MITSQRKKRLLLIVGMMIILIFSLLWHAGSLLKGSRSARKNLHRTQFKTVALNTQPVAVSKKIAASIPEVTTTSEGIQSPVVRKNLPQQQPAVVTKKIAASTAGEIQLAQSTLPAIVRKKLPPISSAPLPQAEPQTVAPAPEVETAKAVEAKPKAPEASEPEPPAAAPPSLPEPTVTAAPAASTPQPHPTSPMAATVVEPKETPPPQKTKPKAPSRKPSAAERSAYPFSLLLSSCREKENAVATIRSFRKDGVTPHIVRTDLGGRGKWWRTLSGSYKTVEAALQAKKSLSLPDAIVVKTPYANLLGEFPSEAEASEQSARFSQSGLFPYQVHEPGQPVLLLVGAFPDRQTAEQFRRELDAKGIAADVILR